MLSLRDIIMISIKVFVRFYTDASLYVDFDQYAHIRWS